MQINRLFEIVYLLLDKEKVTASWLAERFEVSVRTIYRDVEILSSTGVPIYMRKGKGGGISLLPNFVLNKTALTDQEKTDILSAMRAVDSVIPQSTNGAISKLSALLGDKNSDWIEVDFSSWNNNQEEQDLFNSIKMSIISRNEISFVYNGVDGKISKRAVEPLKLCFKGQSWYLYAFCLKRNDYRFFKLRRIKNLEISINSFERKIPEKIFSDKEDYKGEIKTIKLKLSKKIAYRVYDEFLEYEKVDDGFIITFDAPIGEWTYQYILAFGECCEVIEPISVRDVIKQRLEKTLNNYL